MRKSNAMTIAIMQKVKKLKIDTDDVDIASELYSKRKCGD